MVGLGIISVSISMLALACSSSVRSVRSYSGFRVLYHGSYHRLFKFFRDYIVIPLLRHLHAGIILLPSATPLFASSQTWPVLESFIILWFYQAEKFRFHLQICNRAGW